MKQENKIIMMPVADLVPYANNARTHSDAQVDKLCASIAEFGFVNPVLVDGRGMIIAGHGRVMAAKKSGLMSVPTLLVDHLSDVQKKAYILADNKLALDAGWDDSILRDELIDLQQLGYDLYITGFDSAEQDELLVEFDRENRGETDQDDAPSLPDVPVSVSGDLWLLENHRVLCGDTTSLDDMKLLMGGGAGCYGLY